MNQRHKVGLFLTVVGVGLCLLLDVGPRETSGVALLGLAFAWAFGSTNRTLRLGLAGVGLLMFLYPTMDALWARYKAYREYEVKLSGFENQLPQLAKDHPDLSAGIVDTPPPNLPPGYVLVPSKRTIAIPNVGNVEFPLNASSKEIGAALKQSKSQGVPPQWYFEALAAGVDAEEINKLDTPGLIDLAPSVADRIASSYPEEALGGMIMCLFLGTFVVEHKRGRVVPV